MNLKEQLETKLNDAMKAKDEVALSTIRSIKTEIMKTETAGKSKIDLDDAGVTAVIGKLVKQREESIKLFNQGARPDLAEKEQAELDILNELFEANKHFLPTLMSDAEVSTAVAEIIAEKGANDPKQFGMIMGAFNKKFPKKADGKMVSDIVTAQLAQ